VGAKIFTSPIAGGRRPVQSRRARGGTLPALAPLPDEPVIEKELPNAFAGTDLQARLDAAGHRNIVLAGFTTQMCVSSTRVPRSTSGFAHHRRRGLRDARSPDGHGGIIPAATIHDVA